MPAALTSLPVNTAALTGLRGFSSTPRNGAGCAPARRRIVLDEGRIAEVGDYDTLAKKPRPQPVRWLHSPRVAIFPGLIDLHAHVPQYPAVARGHRRTAARGCATTSSRSSANSPARAAGAKAGAFFAELARHGTTTAMLYTAIYEDSAEAAFRSRGEERAAHHHGQNDDGCRQLRKRSSRRKIRLDLAP